MKETSTQLNQLDTAMPEQQLERLKIARRIALNWVNALNQADDSESIDPTLVTLADNIITLSAGEKPDDVLGMSIDDLDFSFEVHCGLERMGIKTVGDFLPLSYRNILRRGRDIGPRRIGEIKAKLGSLGITLPEE